MKFLAIITLGVLAAYLIGLWVGRSAMTKQRKEWQQLVEKLQTQCDDAVKIAKDGAELRRDLMDTLATVGKQRDAALAGWENANNALRDCTAQRMVKGTQ